jgi:hypothetical protein
MIIDLESESVRRFGLPGPAECFAKDLRRVICSRIRIRDGRRYTSFVLIDLPTMFERSILSEDDLPAEEVTSQVDLAVNARISTDRMISTAADRQTRDLMVNDAFDTALWVKQRVDGDQFRYSIVLVDLNTGKRQEVVPESATVPMPVVMAKGTGGWPTALERFNADQTGFLYAIGPRTYFCEIRNRQSVLLADSSIHVDGDEEDTQRSPHGGSYYPTVCSPSGRRALRFANVYEKSRNDERRPRLRFAAIEVFQDAKPVRLYTGQRPITAAGWLDDERIVFQEKDTVYVLESAGGPPRQVFPPVGSTDSE